MPSVTFAAPVPIPSGFKGNFEQVRSYEVHPGTDIPAPSGTRVIAPMDGEIVNVKDNEWPCGGTIDIDYKNGFWSRFCHMKKINVKVGDLVKQGDVVGLSGGALDDYGHGRTTGPHLHFTLKKDGVKVDPIKYINSTVSPSEIQSGEKSSDAEDVKKIASTLGTRNGEMDFETFVKKNPPKEFGKILQKGLMSMFNEEVERIKQLMK